MRRINAIITSLMLILFLIHGIAGALEVMGLYTGINTFVKAMAWLLVTVMSVHVIIGIKLTIDTLIAIRKSGVSYYKENKLFWARRISGLAILVFMGFHIALFMGSGDGPEFRMNYFGITELIVQICFLLSIAVHVISNIKPTLIAFGMKNFKEYAADILIALTIIILFLGVGFIVYFIRWS